MMTILMGTSPQNYSVQNQLIWVRYIVAILFSFLKIEAQMTTVLIDTSSLNYIQFLLNPICIEYLNGFNGKLRIKIRLTFN